MDHEDDVLENVIINGTNNNNNNEITATENETSLILPKYIYPKWYNEIQHGFYRKTICRLQKLFKMNVESAKYYEKINFYIFGPSITITALSSMASFLSTTPFRRQCQNRIWHFCRGFNCYFNCYAVCCWDLSIQIAK